MYGLALLVKMAVLHLNLLVDPKLLTLVEECIQDDTTKRPHINDIIRLLRKSIDLHMPIPRSLRESREKNDFALHQALLKHYQESSDEMSSSKEEE